jgi:hypothetical protein
MHATQHQTHAAQHQMSAAQITGMHNA